MGNCSTPKRPRKVERKAGSRASGLHLPVPSRPDHARVPVLWTGHPAEESRGSQDGEEG